MKGEPMEIEDKLKDAAAWQPNHEMPVGLERRALAQRRPPLRPIGLARPAFSTVLAAAACGFFIYLTGTPEKVVPTPRPSASPIVESPTTPPVENATPTPKPSPAQVAKGNAPPRERRKTPLRARRKRVRVDTEDPIVVQSRVAVDEPVYASAYYAQPSADGTSVEFTPVVATLGDPDVIYTPQE